MAPSDAKLLLPALARFEYIFALASVVPVVSLIRLGRSKHLAAAAPAGERAGQAQAKKESSVPVGIVSVVLLIMSELLACHDLFKASAKGTGRFNDLIKASKKAVEEISASTGGSSKKSAGGLGSVFLNTASKVINGVMSTEENSEAVCSLLLLLGLAVLAGLICYSTISGTKRPRLVQFAACALPVIFFGRSRAELAGKFWKGFVAEKVAAALRLPLRCAALVLANPCEVSEDGTDLGGTPASFAMMQVVSLVASLSGDVVSGRVGGALAQFEKNPWEPKAFFDSEGVALVLPTLLTIIWLCWIHLGSKPGSLSLAALMATAVSPLVLAKWWPVVAKWLGQKGTPEALASVLGLLFAGEVMALFLSGGTVCLLAGMGMLHLLSAIHGMEAIGMS